MKLIKNVYLLAAKKRNVVVATMIKKKFNLLLGNDLSSSLHMCLLIRLTISRTNKTHTLASFQSNIWLRRKKDFLGAARRRKRWRWRITRVWHRKRKDEMNLGLRYFFHRFTMCIMLLTIMPCNSCKFLDHVTRRESLANRCMDEPITSSECKFF